MRLRTIMFILFCVIAVAPMALFWLIPNTAIYSNELEQAEKRQLIIARVLSDRLQSYYENLTNTFRFVVAADTQSEFQLEVNALKETASVKNICLYNLQSKELVRPVSEKSIPCQRELSDQTSLLLNELAKEQQSDLVLSGIEQITPDKSGFFLLTRSQDYHYVATVSADYIRNAGQQVKFGVNGHAAIVDASGRVISHPNVAWETERYDMNAVPVTANMRGRQTGVLEFYSPPLKKDVVAAYTFVKGPGWGVMVPQPIDELMEKVQAVKYSMLTILIIGLLLAAGLAYIASKFLTDPIEQMVNAMHRIGAGELRAYEKIVEHQWQPGEFSAAREGIKAMSQRLQENIDTISRHAYLDGITGLPNRECFRVLAQEEIEKMHLSGRKCALLFLDLDGFKQVNDVYGHRSGDDLLKGFASRLHTHCGNVMKKHARGADNALRILPARLGGDEFVVLLSNMRDASLTAEFADGLFNRVFGPFKIHNGVSLQVSGSVGGAIYPEMATDFDELLRLADIAMYDAKNSGKGRFCLYRPATDDDGMDHRPQMQRV